jgi:hypothetical protein
MSCIQPFFQLQVPASAAAIFQHADRFRQQIGSLDLMVGLYNKLQRTTLPVERPLVSAKLDAAGKRVKLNSCCQCVAPEHEHAMG